MSFRDNSESKHPRYKEQMFWYNSRMSHWQSLRGRLAGAHPAHPAAPAGIPTATEPTAPAFTFSGRLLRALRRQASSEGLDEQTLANELLRQAFIQRQAAEENLSHWRALTRREREVAALVCLGLTNPEIAQQLGISPDTVKTHVHSLLYKFDLRTKGDLRLALADWDFSK